MRLARCIGGAAAGLLALLALLLGVAPAHAQQPPRADRLGPLLPGTVVERVVSAADTTLSWALYLPSTYDPARTWPVLFAMDPRGRAMLPLERFVAVAERYGWIVMSSYDTESDFLGADPNEPALGAMLEDAQTLFALDGRRLYLAGFSGTARAAWQLGVRLTGNLAGIIGVGGGMPQPMYEADLTPLTEFPELGFHGLVGTRDFNHDEMWRLEALLDGYGIANALGFFDGGHEWAPEAALADAVAWMEVRAMVAGLRPPDRALADSLAGARLAAADSLEAAEDAVMAWRAYDAVATDFAGAADPALVGRARERADSLAATPAVESGARRAAELRERFWEVVEVLDDALFDVQVGVREADAVAGAIGLDGLLAEAADTADPLRAAAAHRVLEHVWVTASFYQPRTLADQGRTDDALALLELADRIFPERPQACLFRARALGLAGRIDEAVDAARCAVDRGLSPDVLGRDPELSMLRDDPAFRALVGGGEPEGG